MKGKPAIERPRNRESKTIGTHELKTQPLRQKTDQRPSGPLCLDPLGLEGSGEDSSDRLHFPADSAADPSPKCGAPPPGLMGSVVPGQGQASGMVCLCLYLEGTEPQSFTGSLGEPQRLLVPAGYWVSRTQSTWVLGLPLPLQHHRGTPIRCPRPPVPFPTLGGRPAPLRVAPLTSRRGGGGAGPAPGSAAAAGPGSALRPPAAQGTPARDAPSRLLQPPRPQAPPHTWPEPQSSSGDPQDCPCCFSSSGSLPLALVLALSLSLFLSRSPPSSLPQGLWVSASLSPRPLMVCLSPCVSVTSPRPGPQHL